MGAIVYHIQLGRSRDRSWCGRYIGFHVGLASTTEDDYRDKVVKGLTRNICKNCIRSLEANR